MGYIKIETDDIELKTWKLTVLTGKSKETAYKMTALRVLEELSHLLVESDEHSEYRELLQAEPTETILTDS